MASANASVDRLALRSTIRDELSQRLQLHQPAHQTLSQKRLERAAQQARERQQPRVHEQVLPVASQSGALSSDTGPKLTRSHTAKLLACFLKPLLPRNTNHSHRGDARD